MHAHLRRRHFRRDTDVEAKRVAEKRERRRQIGDGNAT